jgi:hypothetical protein
MTCADGEPKLGSKQYGGGVWPVAFQVEGMHELKSTLGMNKAVEIVQGYIWTRSLELGLNLAAQS